jgi:non-homologous end joining protein Ku
VTVERGDLVRGYEFAKNQYIQLTEPELESLEAESSNNIELGI